MTSPVFQALVNARLAQVSKAEAQISEQVEATLGPPPPDVYKPLRFARWCEDQGLPWRPANPAVIAKWVLQLTKIGNSVEELRTLSAAHTSQGLADPCCAYQVTEALSRLVQVEPPRSWPKEKQLLFACLPEAIQQYLSIREKDRDTAIRRSQNDAASWRKHLEEIQKGTEANGAVKEHPAENVA